MSGLWTCDGKAGWVRDGTFKTIDRQFCLHPCQARARTT